ncbi:MAG: hypothetical protein DYH02_07175 [Candidatus Omnitrophica bacterium COP1]|nr:hypothetical protein [Candidatus Omnitrophica bacterium COP1]
MKSALQFLKSLSQSSLPPVIHLLGDDLFIRGKVLAAIRNAWFQGEGDSETTSLHGSEHLSRLKESFSFSSLFASRKMVLYWDRDESRTKSQSERRSKSKKGIEKAGPLLSADAGQVKGLLEVLKEQPVSQVCLVFLTPLPDKETVFQKAMSGVAEQVQVSLLTPEARRGWISLLAREAGVTLEPELAQTMEACHGSMLPLWQDLCKLAGYTEGKGEATLEMWEMLTQVNPETSLVWSIGDALNRKDAGGALWHFQNLLRGGLEIYQILPALHTWCTQRLQIRSHDLSDPRSPLEGVHPFVQQKVRGHIAKTPLSKLRGELQKILYLDRCTKQSWETPSILLEKDLIEFSREK